MDTERFRRISDVFNEVADLPPGPGRDQRLSELSTGDASITREVMALLDTDAALEAPAAAAAGHIGLRLGNYEIGPLVARGGMASVYAAHRADDQFQQRVAVKIMDVRLSDQDLLARFRGERQILASLEHVAITRLIDGGVTALGEPYLVMEYVDGQPIDEYCNQHRLDLASRIRVFTQACAGVAFAHRNMVLHRDLKPSNILVTREGLPKVVDFGTAALLQPDRLATISRAPLTPAFASPEQLLGKPVSTAADQYSLGLVLYELLSGTPAVARGTSLIAAVERALAGTEPAPAHLVVTDEAAAVRATTATQLRRRLSGDLGTILRKSLAHDAAQRYASVEHLVEDLERWLAGKPIFGRPQSLGYRVSRFLGRHRAAVATAGVLVLALGVASTQWIRQTRVARIESARARELNRFLTDMLSSANPAWFNANGGIAGTITVRQALDGAAQALDRAPGDPAVEAEMRRVVGGTYLGLGANDQALPHLTRALALFTQQGDRLGTARSRSLLGVERMARGDFKAAEALQRQAFAEMTALGDLVEPAVRAAIIGDLAAAIAYQRPGDDEAIALMRQSIAIANPHQPALAAVGQHNLGVQLVRKGRLDEAEGEIRESLRRMTAMPMPPPERASALRTLAVLLWQKGAFAEAEPLAREAVEVAIKTRPPEHPLLPNNKAWWGRTLVAIGDGERARTVSQDAYDGYRRIRPAGHQDLALPLIGLGAAYRLLGQLPESERTLREAHAIIVKFPAQRDRIADAAGELGLTLRAMGRTEEAGQLLRDSHDRLQALYGDAHPLTKAAAARLHSGI